MGRPAPPGRPPPPPPPSPCRTLVQGQCPAQGGSPERLRRGQAHLLGDDRPAGLSVPRQLDLQQHLTLQRLHRHSVRRAAAETQPRRSSRPSTTTCSDPARGSTCGASSTRSWRVTSSGKPEGGQRPPPPLVLPPDRRHSPPRRGKHGPRRRSGRAESHPDSDGSASGWPASGDPNRSPGTGPGPRTSAGAGGGPLGASRLCPAARQADRGNLGRRAAAVVSEPPTPLRRTATPRGTPTR
jgi:hypothetical protein